jgi:putative inorganic carbon (hco3(-)) transporter
VRVAPLQLNKPDNLLKTAWWAGIAAILGGVAAFVPPALIALTGILLIGVIQPAALYVVMLVVAPIKTLIETEARISLDLGQYAFIASAALIVMQRIALRRPLFRRAWSPVIFALAVMIIGAGASLFTAIAPGQTLSELVKWVEILLAATLTAMLCDQIGYKPILAGLLFAGGVQAVIGLHQFTGGSGAAHLWILDNRFFRAFGTYGQPNPFGAHMELVLVLGIGALCGAIAARRVGWTIGLLIACGVLGAGLIASWSRGAWIGAGTGIAAIIFFAPRRRWVGAGLVIGGGLLFVALAVFGLLPGSVVARLSDFAQDLTGFADVRGQEISDARYAVLERLAHWQAAIGMMDDHPLIGVGFGNYEAAYPRYALMNWKYALGHAHNYYLNALAETGLIGFLSYVGGWASIIFLTIRAIPRLSGLDRGVMVGLVGVWIALAVHSVFDKLYVNNLFLHIGTMFGLIIALRVQPAQTEEINGK